MTVYYFQGPRARFRKRESRCRPTAKSEVSHPRSQLIPPGSLTAMARRRFLRKQSRQAKSGPDSFSRVRLHDRFELFAVGLCGWKIGWFIPHLIPLVSCLPHRKL